MKQPRFKLTANLKFTTDAKDEKTAKARLKFWVEGINKTVSASTNLKVDKIKCNKLPF